MPPTKPFRLALRVYYEDTDAAGVVYYANYLKYMERARTEWLTALGFELAAIEREHGVVFAVRHADVHYRQPARLGDRLEVSAALAESGRARLVVRQDVTRGDDLLVDARVTLACIDRNEWRPARIPAPVAQCMETLA